MEKQCAGAASVDYWDRNAKWYKLWVEHNRYHDRIIELLTRNATPGWKVLDIGAGHGILSIPLAVMGCQVTALEPSLCMRRLLTRHMVERGVTSIAIEPSRWEDFPIYEPDPYDLIIASNSLHLTEIGFELALRKIFLKSRPLFRSFHIMTVTYGAEKAHSSLSAG